MDTTIKRQLKDLIETSYLSRASKNPEIKNSKHVSYGTAGFRGKADEIEHLFFNIGLLSGLRAMNLGANVGVMITASHNPADDNGVKLIDSRGEMLHSDWEKIAEEFCNNQDTSACVDHIDKLVKLYEIDVESNINHRVLLGRDTRPSSQNLANLVEDGLSVWSKLKRFEDRDSVLIDYGLVTTPALHYLVAKSNEASGDKLPTVIGYYDQLVEASTIIGQDSTDVKKCLHVDCSNGVGAVTMEHLCDRFKKYDSLPDIKLINRGDGILNKDCGADFVKTHQLAPLGANELKVSYASLDGDADRIVYFYLTKKDATKDIYDLNLLDGDRILILFARYLKDQIQNCGLDDKLSLGIIQTPYANGASTRYLKQILGLEVEFADTGVKNLHKKALKYDMAAYFEANGHGTIHITDETRAIINDEYQRTKSVHCQHLNHVLRTLNNYTGDAISNMILVEIILSYYHWDIETWYQLYNDLPYSLIKIQVPDKNLIKTKNAGQICSEPREIQPIIDEIVRDSGESARCFIRPSGTEDIVRIYAEALTKEEAEKLANRVMEKLDQFFSELS